MEKENFLTGFREDIGYSAKIDIFEILNNNIYQDDKGRLIIDFEEIKIKFNESNSDRRNAYRYLKYPIMGFFLYESKKFRVNRMTIVDFIFEALKNIADRTNSDGSFKIKMIISQDNQLAKIFLAIGDDGAGISKTMHDPDKQSSAKKNGYNNCGAGFEMNALHANRLMSPEERRHCGLYLFDHRQIFTLSMPDLASPNRKHFEDVDFRFTSHKMQYLFELVISQQWE